MGNHSLSAKHSAYLKENNAWLTPQRLDYSLKQFFKGCDLTNKSVLEIGAGRGHSSIWCVLQGAEKVVALEPEASGSSVGMQQEFEDMAQSLGLKERIEYITTTFEEYVTGRSPYTFDYVLMEAVINHLDENATQRLHIPEAERERGLYREKLKQICGVLKPGGIIVIYDVGRRNFWHDLKLRNPFSPTIEYQKHQQPGNWLKLLCQSGFESMDVRWFVPYRLRLLRPLLSYKLSTYFLNSAFILRCKRSLTK